MAKSKKETRGRKPNSEKGKEIKKSYPAYLYPSDKDFIDETYGGITKAIEKKILNTKKK